MPSYDSSSHLTPSRPGRRAPERASARQPAGFQCVLRLALHAASVCALALSSAAGLLALGDEAGRLSLVDLRQARPPPCS